MLCSQVMCQPKLFLCAFIFVINSKRGGALKVRVLIVWHSYVQQALGNVGAWKFEVLSQRDWVEYKSNAWYNRDYLREGCLCQHLYVQVACTLERVEMFNPCIYAFSPT